MDRNQAGPAFKSKGFPPGRRRVFVIPASPGQGGRLPASLFVTTPSTIAGREQRSLGVRHGGW